MTNRNIAPKCENYCEENGNCVSSLTEHGVHVNVMRVAISQTLPSRVDAQRIIKRIWNINEHHSKVRNCQSRQNLIDVSPQLFPCKHNKIQNIRDASKNANEKTQLEVN